MLISKKIKFRDKRFLTYLFPEKIKRSRLKNKKRYNNKNLMQNKKFELYNNSKLLLPFYNSLIQNYNMYFILKKKGFYYWNFLNKFDKKVY